MPGIVVRNISTETYRALRPSTTGNIGTNRPLVERLRERSVLQLDVPPVDKYGLGHCRAC